MHFMRRLLVLGCVVAICTSGAMAKRNKLPLDFTLEPILTGFDRPSAMAITDDGRVYVAERFTGNVFLVRDGRLVATPVLTLAVAGGTDEGLLDIAYDAAGPQGGYLYVFYTEAGTADNKVARYTLSGNGATDPLTVVSLGASPGPDPTRIGGGLAVGNDGKIYVSVGDMQVSADAQNPASNHGKVLRLNPDGSIPADNPDPASAVYARGFRDGVGLATHPNVPTLYLTDRGPAVPPGEFDELNAVAAGGDHGWDAGTGTGVVGDTDPLESLNPLVDPSGPAAYSGTFLPDLSTDGNDNDLDGLFDERDERYDDSLFFGCRATPDIVRSVLVGANLDAQDATPAPKFFDSSIEWDGTPDTACPPAWSDLEQGGDGMLYGLADDATGTLDGLYRVVYDRPGPREVSPPGSVLPLSVEKSGPDLTLYWENVDRDAWVGTTRGASQPLETYTVWEGTLPITSGAYTHTVKATTDGTAVNEGLLSATITPVAGNTYYLISSQGANLEGPLGKDSGGTDRPGKAIQDYCNEIGFYESEYGDATKETRCDGLDDDGDGKIDESCPGRCAPDFVDGTGQPARLLDQYGNYWSLWDFRGNVVHMDLSALDCGVCQSQAPLYADFYNEYKGRGFKHITVLANTFGSMDPIPPAQCASQLQFWINTYIEPYSPGSDEMVMCAADDDGDGVVDIYEQFGEHLYLYLGLFWSRCTGTPQNLFFDQGMVNYESVCGKWTDDNLDRQTILSKLPPERCE